MVGFNKPYPYVDRPQSEGRPNLERGWKGKQKKKKKNRVLSGFNRGDTQPLANYAINEIAKLSSRFERSPWERPGYYFLWSLDLV